MTDKEKLQAIRRHAEQEQKDNSIVLGVLADEYDENNPGGIGSYLALALTMRYRTRAKAAADMIEFIDSLEESEAGRND